MPTNIIVKPQEGGVIHILASFTDEDGQDITPTEIGYKLTDATGTEIKARATITPATSVVITLSGSDLAKQGPSDDLRRACLIDYTYDSSYGSGLKDQDEARFSLADLWAVT